MTEAEDVSSQAGPHNKASVLEHENCMPAEPHPQRSQGSASASSDGGSFDCNICLELAHDPVVTLCGHLYCWSCLYRWLHLHSNCQECPVCKALVSEETVVPLYGRGNSGSSDPRTKTVPGMSVPQRPAGHRPETARPPEFQFPPQGFNAMAGRPDPVAAARVGNFSFSAGFGLVPSLFGLQMHGFQDTIGFGPGYSFGLPMGWHNAPLHPHAVHLMPDGQQEALLSKVFLVLGILVALCILVF